MNESKPQVLLKHYLKKLKLPTILREYEAMAIVCMKERCDYSTFLLRIVERESLDRQKRAAERRVKSARFPVIKTLDTFDFSLQPSINEKLVRELMTGEYLDRKENILLVGNSGTGKTHLVSSIGFAGCMQGRKVRFFTVKALVTHLLEMTEQRQLERTFRQLERQDLLILDEPSLGLSPLLVEEMFALIGRLHEEGLSILLVEQNVFQSLEIADRAYVLENGVIAMAGAADAMMNDEGLRKSYLGM